MIQEGVVERMSSPYEIIGKNLFKKETNIQLFVNLKVTLSTGETGLIEGHFGQSGKLKIRFMGKELITLFIHQLPGNFLFKCIYRRTKGKHAIVAEWIKEEETFGK